MCFNSSKSIMNDPQVGAAAARQAAVAERAQSFSEQYYRESIQPLIKQMMEQSSETQAQQTKIFDLQFPLAEKQAAQFTQYGLPAQEKYYQMVQQYSAPEEYERQAQEAMGDVISRSQIEQQNTDRMLASRGIDPTSGAAVSGAYQNQIRNAAMGAAASNRARNAARQLGIQMTAGAADFSAGRPASNVGMFANGASNASSQAFGTTTGALGAASTGAQVPMSGFQLSGNIYGQQMQTYGNMAGAQANANAQSSSGTMGAIGTVAGAAIAAY